ncbi:Nop52-domain-containing protein [Dacryopinax primogenitus]|uniref:Nop52-domain-containing protein n=1 Tax=Dacryopinax primogenitus (strain DJM 731) TaxID=1858805 RepID=M5G9K7_DACPD|nr:Nop52-domain-containing protein [Dacryopinax primogenitus]EJU02547.1 Nop52-domain-containing protein [Dacryopinax primogenitus]
MAAQIEASTSSFKPPPLGKYLAHNDKQVRDKAVASLRSFLVSSPHALPRQEMTKLWKGLFYCYWHSDKPLVQQALSSELATLPLEMDDPARALAFLRGFWGMVVREWNGIDRLRMDKYYMLVRKFVNGGFRLLAREDWDEQCIQEWNDQLSGPGGPLDPTDPKIPQSLAYHIADIYLDELQKIVQELPSPPPLALLAQPFLYDMSLNQSKILFDRLVSALLSPLLFSLSAERVEETPYLHLMGAIGQQGDRRGMKKALLSALFEQANKPETKEVNRRKMHRIWREEMAGDQPVGTALPEA